MSEARELRLLLVEDNPTDALLLRETLAGMQGFSFSVTHAERLDECLQFLGAGPFDVAMVDLGLPDSAGLDTFRKVHAAAPELPVVVLTGLEDEETGVGALHLGAQDYVMKSQAQTCSLARIIRYAIERNELICTQRKLEEHVRHVQKLEAVGQLAAGLGHDFNNLLTVINGYSDLLSRDAGLPESARKRIAAIHDSCQRARKLTRQLLAFSRKNVSCPEVLNLNDVLAGMAPLLGPLMGADVELSLSLEPDLGFVRMDPGEIEQVVMNLAVNARDAMAGSGTLTIETAGAEGDSSQVPVQSGVKPGPLVMLSVRDTGCGMDKVTMARIFEPFFTTKDVGKGAGLGLATVYGIVTKAGGRVIVDSEPAHGAVFRIVLPSAAGAPSQPDASPGAFSSVSERASGETILVAEDDDLVRQFVCDVLRPLGYHIIPARNGHEALLLWPSIGQSVDLLLTDVRMPTIGGAELAQTLLRERPWLKVLFMAGYVGAELDWQETAFARARVIQKPFSPEVLASGVRDALHSRDARPTVLVVDDMADVRNLLRDVLEAEGLLVEEAADGKRALNLTRKKSPDLVIIDLVMPEMEGIETIQRIRQMNSSAKILAISGTMDGGNYLRAAKFLGANCVLAKPIDMEALVATVRELLDPGVGKRETAKPTLQSSA